MKLTINGEEQQIPETVESVEQLLAHFNVAHKKSVVEKNGEILTKPEQKESLLNENDRLEIVHFVGGG
ncbi:sulfur carrier protein [Sinobaca qinghaiensis]|uniref:Sulfur carrier protein n=1 Tax=Sinobaca qinghaiensis TaxID=342944 RepID=A0A419V468_9BACL|nr:sulfur carrier protein ThiS [Sinobaca qinghaiensis]RKD73290.1 sulfur carrier protein [Sinobaca qinghaiensis]